MVLGFEFGVLSLSFSLNNGPERGYRIHDASNANSIADSSADLRVQNIQLYILVQTSRRDAGEPGARNVRTDPNLLASSCIAVFRFTFHHSKKEKRRHQDVRFCARQMA